ncbi:MAG: NUDIX hydrolase [Polyangiaceae bacterium]|nr:NUDIX hydrolase [Polyangiaceae bacterium]
MAFRPLRDTPQGLLRVGKEILRHIIRRPVVGIAVLLRDEAGNVVLIRRADTGGLALPGGTLEWGETLRTSLAREIREETGVANATFQRVTGVYSDPSRDPRFHAVTVVVECTYQSKAERLRAENPLEIVEVTSVPPAEVPKDLSMKMGDMFRDALAARAVVLE